VLPLSEVGDRLMVVIVVVVDVVIVGVLTFHLALRLLSCFASGSFD